MKSGSKVTSFMLAFLLCVSMFSIAPTVSAKNINIEKVSGVFGGIKTDEPIQNCGNNGIGIENAININGENTINNSSTGTNLPAKNTFWNKVKSVLFYDIKVELTPYEQKVEDEVNEFLHQEVTWTKVKNFLFQEVTFGKKKNL